MSKRPGEIEGMGELLAWLKQAPAAIAQATQDATIRGHIAHRREILRTTTFSAQGRRGLTRAIRIEPAPNKKSRAVARRIQDVKGETFSVWKGESERPVAEGTAALLEKQIGPAALRPSRARALLVPAGDFLTPTGRPRRKGRQKLDLSEVPDTTIVKTGGKRRLIQRLEAGKRGQYESGAKGIHRKQLGRRARIVAFVVKRVDHERGIDFFGSWNRLQASRDKLLDNAIAKVVNTRASVAA